MSTATIEAPTVTNLRTSPRLEQLCTERVDGALALANNRFEGYRLPWLNLEKHTDTWLPGDLVEAVAYTGSGKTTFVMNLVAHWALQQVRVLLFGTEQEPKALLMKQACMKLGIPFGDARRGRLDEVWQVRLNAEIEAQRHAPNNLTTYYPSSSPTTAEVVQAITAGAKKGIQIFVIDYLGRMDYSGIKAGSEWQQVKVFIRELKNLAVKLNVLIVACAQIMSKGDESSLVSHKPPLLSSIQGGQAIAMEADIVIGIYQPISQTATRKELDAATKSGNVDDVLEKSTAAVIVLKHREDGSRRNKQALFWVKHNKFIIRNPQDATMPEGVETSEYERDMAEKKRVQGKHDEQHADVESSEADESRDPWDR